MSSTLHGTLVLAVFLVLFISHHRKTSSVDIVIYEAPKAAQQALQLTEPKKEVVKPRSREVFGITPKAVATDLGETVKAGNTVAKTPDQIQLKPGDADALPVPSEDYLVSKMPVLKSEVRVPYPPNARRRGIQGAVAMDLLIDGSGKVRDVALVESPDPELSAAAMAAARGFQFSAALIQDKPVAVRIRYVYRFVLD